jgi:hypothetical protein
MLLMGEGIPDRKWFAGFAARPRALASVVGCILLPLALAAACAVAEAIPGPQSKSTSTLVDLHVSVVDENGAAVPSARITLTPSQGKPIAGETDYAGRKEFHNLAAGEYHLRVEKEGFFAVNEPGIHAGEILNADVSLHHIREFPEQVNVVYSPPAIDPAKTQASER